MPVRLRRLLAKRQTITGSAIGETPHPRNFSPGNEPQGTKDLYVVMKKSLPKFKNEEQERDFWASHDSVDYIDWRKAKRVVLPNLKPSSQVISLRLPKPMLEQLKSLANKRDVPYQTLLKIFIAERIKAELES
jgi:predicted DNA binding CopG/RHH family protein